MKTNLVILLTLLMLSSCASQPAYRPAKGDGVGYKETALDANTYRIEFKARSGSLHNAQDMALLRAAEVTTEKGYDWFVVAKRDTEKNRERSAPPMLSNREVVSRDCGLLACRTSVQTVPQIDFGPDEEVTDEINVILEINFGKGVRPEKNSYEAAEVIATIHKK